ncbi:phthiocerol/phthiodiolone dimycocerosyl transferase family protein [Williamsia maris]|uniref:Phthiocerol/phthiodiolone dimycocerosyl transferase n=1 Tax=Williamsia maris TaxID=72806 RepID=A0ABT1HJC6_9NOCA|nr:acyltransferase [Williamsia maris]MCP2178038.1 Phthiocerol/phthiodiolone dimycocerosyl transferase C-terminus [Williamsia maris]
MTYERRALSALELPYAQTNTISCGTFVLQGSLEVPTLAAAFQALQREFPVLAGHIAIGADGAELVAGDTDASPVFVQEQRKFTPGDVHLKLQPLHQLSGVLVVTDGDRHQTTLGVNHAVADGTHAAFLLLRLWEHYTCLIETGQAHPAARNPLPSSPSQTAQQVGVLADGPPPRGFGEIRSNGIMPTANDVGGELFDFCRVVVDESTFTRVRHHAKAAGVSVHAFVSGVITLAERRTLAGVRADAVVPMGVFSPVDLRSRFRPAIGSAAVTNFAGASRVTVNVTAASDPIAIGRAVSAQLHSDIEDTSVHRDLFGTGDHEPGTAETAAPIRISNIGLMPEPALPSNLACRDFHTSSHVDMNAVRALIALSPPGESLPALMGMHYHVMSFAGRLSIEMRGVPGSVPVRVADAIVSDILAQLHTQADAMIDLQQLAAHHGE